MKAGRFTSRSLVRKYLDRIDEIDKGGRGNQLCDRDDPDACL